MTKEPFRDIIEIEEERNDEKENRGFALSGIFTVAGMFSGCSNGNYIQSEEYDYYTSKEEEWYAVIRDNFDRKDTLTLPAYYKEKEVRYSYYYLHRATGSTFYCLESQAETIYYPFCHRWDFSKGAEKANLPGKSIYLSHISERYAYETLEILYHSEWDEKRLYLTPSLFNSFQQNINEQKWSFTENLEENFSVCYKRNKRGIEGKEDRLILQKANVSYMFDYADEPNEGYFFVNDFERGGKIETTPYEPLRSGYAFEGWYKDAECNNEWDFETDTLPEAEYDEEGVLRFVETKLYAK